MAGIFAGWLFRFREPKHDLLVNLLTYVTFPLVVGVAFRETIAHSQITSADPAYYVLVFCAFLLALALNFSMIALDACYLERSSFVEKVRTVMFPLLPSELAAALMAVGVAFTYIQIGLAGVALFGIVLVTFQYLLGALLKSQERAGSSRRGPTSWPASRSGC